MNQSALRIGIDLGGTKIAGIALGPGDQVLVEDRIAAPRGDYIATIYAIADMAHALEQQAGAATGWIGIGIPGSISPRTGLVQNANSTWLNGNPLQFDLTRVLRRLVKVENDANCFVLSEVADGAARGAKSAFGVILGTGCGGGFFVNRRLVNGPRAIAGEWGHTPLPWPEPGEAPGRECWCGLKGCMETWVSGPALERSYEEETGSVLPGVEIAALRGKDANADKVLDAHLSRLARGLASVVNILDPEVIVLGGGLSQMDHLYAELPEAMKPYIFSDDTGVTVRKPVHGDASGVRGAARLWDNA